MSRNNRGSGSSSPVKKYLSFKAGIGEMTYYDKDKKEDVYVDSLDLVLVDDLASVGGFNEAESSGFNSNLLNPYDTGKKEFTVKCRVGGQYRELITGIWKEIKNEGVIKGSKFARNLFAIADVGDGKELIKLELIGAGLSPWLDLLDDASDDIYDKVIRITRGQLFMRKGGQNSEVSTAEYDKMLKANQKDPRKNKMPVLFYAPNIELISTVSEDDVTLAEEADARLQSYLQLTPPDEKSEDTVESKTSTRPEAPAGNEPDDLPF